MQGFIGLKIPDLITKVIAIVPGMLIIVLGINPMKALLLSQVTLSFVLPIAIIPMLWITSQEKYMGDFINKKPTKIVGWLITLFIVGLNTVLLVYTVR